MNLDQFQSRKEDRNHFIDILTFLKKLTEFKAWTSLETTANKVHHVFDFIFITGNGRMRLTEACLFFSHYFRKS